MCGISGWINYKGIDLKYLVAMSRSVSHRGPDGEGYWLWNGDQVGGKRYDGTETQEIMSEKGWVGLGHRRLAIIDLTESGLQPMASKDGEVWIVYNGEIYNYLEIRNELKTKGHIFVTQTDTEVIIESYIEWGVDCFEHFNGMWGLAIVDLKKRQLILSRDRLGIKPLYFWTNKNSLAFSSEIKQFFSLPDFCARANPVSLANYVENGYETPPATFFENVMAFPAGSFAEVNIDTPDDIRPISFWKTENSSSYITDRNEALEELQFLFTDAVSLRLRSDVPVGVCLSGGLDSSLIFAKAHELISGVRELHAFSASYKEKNFDESYYVKLVERKYGGEIHYTYPSAVDFLADFSDLVYQHDEPPGAISQYAAWTVMRLSKDNHVPVLLNGQGGDELFSGYWPAYYLFLRSLSKQDPIKFAAHIIGSFMPNGNLELIKQIPSHFRQFLVRRNRAYLNILKPDYHKIQISQINKNWASIAQTLSPQAYRWGEISQIHLPRLLKWDDRNSMAFSIEGRYPFLDYRLAEFAMKIHPDLNFHAGWNKYLLRQSLGYLLPNEIQWRRSKVGFVTPQSQWLQSDLKPVFLDWMNNPSSNIHQIVDVKIVREIANKLLSNKTIHPMDESQHLIFRLFALDTWIQRFKVTL